LGALQENTRCSYWFVRNFGFEFRKGQYLKDTIIDLLKKDYNPSEIKIKLRELEFDMKKELFFEKRL
jgi:hypothetical protein